MVFSLNVFVAPANDTRSTTPSTNERLNHIISNAEEHVSSVAFSRSYSSTVVGSQVSFVSCVLSQILRYVYVEAVNVTDETDTSSIKQTSFNDTFPTRVVRHISQVRQSAQVELRLRANNRNHASHRYVCFLQSVLGVCKVFWSQLVGRQRIAVTGANETVLSTVDGVIAIQSLSITQLHDLTFEVTIHSFFHLNRSTAQNFTSLEGSLEEVISKRNLHTFEFIDAEEIGRAHV